jgi:hypothetical protein
MGPVGSRGANEACVSTNGRSPRTDYFLEFSTTSIRWMEWAPPSIKELDFEVFEHRGCWKRGIVTDSGLTVQLPGFKLSRLSHNHEALNVTNTCDGDETTSADNTLVIHTLDEASDNINPWRRGWQRLRFRKIIGSDFNTRGFSWTGLVKTGAIENLAILIQEEGVLVERYRKEEECNLELRSSCCSHRKNNPKLRARERSNGNSLFWRVF